MAFIKTICVLSIVFALIFVAQADKQDDYEYVADQCADYSSDTDCYYAAVACAHSYDPTVATMLENAFMLDPTGVKPVVHNWIYKYLG